MIQTKTCTNCKKRREITQFFKNNQSKDGYFCYCTPCKVIKNRESRRRHRDKYNEKSRKYNNLPYRKIYNQKRAKIYYKNGGKEKQNAARRKWRKNNPLKYLEEQLKENYNITLHDYETLLKLQYNRCAICRKHVMNLPKRLYVDHCHKTGKIRGLLCNSCNTALGLLKDDISLFKRSIDYLNKNIV